MKLGFKTISVMTIAIVTMAMSGCNDPSAKSSVNNSENKVNHDLTKRGEAQKKQPVLKYNDLPKNSNVKVYNQPIVVEKPAEAYQFKMGIDYQEIPNPLIGYDGLTEFFSFYCPHCYHFERLLTKLTPMIKQEVRVNKSHVNFMRNASVGIQNDLSKAYLIADMMGEKKETIIQALFDQIHIKKIGYKSREDVRQLLLEHGVPSMMVDAQLNSQETTNAVQKMINAQKSLTEQNILDGVPTLIVDGKYKINMREIKSLGRLSAIIKYLHNKKV